MQMRSCGFFSLFSMNLLPGLSWSGLQAGGVEKNKVLQKALTEVLFVLLLIHTISPSLQRICLLETSINPEEVSDGTL
jgi:hypothetical protein